MHEWFLKRFDIKNVRPLIDEIKCDLVCAIEVIEHFPSDEVGVGDPITELKNNILYHTNEDSLFAYSSRWRGETNGWLCLGHFLNYKFDNSYVSNIHAGKTFNKKLNEIGWKKIIRLRNGCPYIFKKNI